MCRTSASSGSRGDTFSGEKYGLSIPPTHDFSDEINAQVAAAGGEAVVGLTITVRARCDWLNGFPLLDALPIWPGCVPVRLTGDIVRR